VDDQGFARVRPRLEEAARLHQTGQRSRAIALYRSLLSDAPQLPPLLNLFGLALVQDGAVAEGLQQLSQAVRLAPGYPDAWLNLAFARYEAQDRDGAVEAYRTLLKLQPSHVVALLSLASLTAESDAIGSVALLRRATQAAPDLALPWLRLRRACYLLGDPAGVAEADQQVARIGLKSAEELVEAGNIELMQNNTRQAVALLTRARQQQPGFPPAALALGEALLQEQDYPSALRALQEAAALAPRRSTPWTMLGRVHLAMGQRREAADAFRQALEREESAVSRHLLAAALGETTTAAPLDYVVWRYRHRAVNYDQYLRDLGNEIPARVGALLRKLATARFENAIDLGCGTGLVAEELRPLVRRLVGLDPSLAMLNQAQRTRRYDDLIEQEAVAYLQGTRERFDLALAIDMLIYLGDLAPLFNQVMEHLEQGGLFVITFEHPEDDAAPGDFALQASGSYVHSVDYVRRIARATGFEPESWDPVELPREPGKPRRGTLAALRRVATDSGRA